MRIDLPESKKRVELMDCLRADPIILQHVHAKGLISYVQYQDLKHMTKPSQAVTELLDVLIGKGQETCAQFLQLLEEPDCLDTYPQLKNILDMKYLTFCSVGVEHHVLEALIVLIKLTMPCRMLCILHHSHFQQMTGHTGGTLLQSTSKMYWSRLKLLPRSENAVR
uniref:CARD domain-containing protein n=1 Tax=Salarias fasciatus TaxID=181472 RepID=A0A672ICT5_SALFA